MPFDPKSKDIGGAAAAPADTGTPKTKSTASKEAGVAAPEKKAAARPKTTAAKTTAAKTTASKTAASKTAAKTTAAKTTTAKSKAAKADAPAEKTTHKAPPKTTAAKSKTTTTKAPATKAATTKAATTKAATTKAATTKAAATKAATSKTATSKTATTKAATAKTTAAKATTAKTTAAKKTTTKKAADKTAEKAPLSAKDAAIKERAAATLAAAQAAQTARQQAQQKRSAIKKVEGPTGSIYAASLREGARQTPEADPQADAAGSIYAAAMREEAAEPDVKKAPAPVAAPKATPAKAAAPEAQAAPEVPEVPETADEAAPAEAEAEEVEFEPEFELEPDTDLEPDDEPGPDEAGASADIGMTLVGTFIATKPLPQFGQKSRPPQKSKKKKAPKVHKPVRLRQRNALEQRVLGNPAVRAIGGMLYSLGFYAECRVMQVWRVVRDVVVFMAQLLAWVFGAVFGSFGRMFGSLFKDLAAPFVRFGAGIGHVRQAAREEKAQGGSGPKAAVRYFGGGIKRHAHLLGNLTGFIAPLVSAVVLGFVVYNIAGSDYALSVEWQGKTIGYIADQTVLDDAKSILRGRIRLGHNQSMEDWNFTPDLTVAKTNNFTSKDQLVNTILRNTSMDIVEGTGLYIGEDNLVAVTTEGERLRAFLDETLDKHRDPENPDATPSFVQDVICEPESEDVFLTDSVRDFDELVEELSSTVSEEKYYTTQEDDTLGEIARDNNLVFQTLLSRNPQFAKEDADFEPEPGTRLLIQRAKPFLQVQTTVRQESEEAIPFKEVEKETDELPLSLRRFEQKGEDGVQRVWDDYVYIEGELERVDRVDELTEVLMPPVEQVTLVGTYDFSDAEMSDYNPAYRWPVPDYTYSSRGGGPGMGHRGRDINAPAGTPILAANAGVVIVSGSHYSYGNYIVIEHPDGLRTLYGHCTTLIAQKGDVVKQGQFIATVGNTGFSFGNHVHLEFQTSSGQLLQPDDYVVAPHGYGRG